VGFAQLDYPATLKELMDWRGHRVIVTVGSLAENGPPLIARMTGTLLPAFDDANSPDERIKAPLMFTFEEHDSTFELDPEAFHGAQASAEVLRVALGDVVVEAVRADEHTQGGDAAADERGNNKTLLPSVDVVPLVERGPSDRSSAPPDHKRSALRRPVAWLSNTVIAAIIAALITAAVTVWVVWPATHEKPLNCASQKINPNGAISQATGTRIVKRLGSRNAFVVENGVFHHIPDGSTYIHDASCFPVQFNVDEAGLRQLRRKDGSDAHSPTGTQPKIGPTVLRDGYLLREVDDKTFWQIMGGHRVPVADKQTFNCLTRRFLVWDHVAPHVVARFPPDRPRGHARCT